MCAGGPPKPVNPIQPQAAAIRRNGIRALADVSWGSLIAAPPARRQRSERASRAADARAARLAAAAGHSQSRIE